MKLHLPTRLRAALVAAMVFVASAPAAMAIDIDPSTAEFNNLLKGSTDTVTIPEYGWVEVYNKETGRTEPVWQQIDSSAKYYDNTLSLYPNLDLVPQWEMVIQASGWKATKDQLVFSWNDSSPVPFVAGNYLTYNGMDEGFALMLSNGRLMLLNPDTFNGYNGPANAYPEEACLLTGLGNLKKLDLEVTLSYDFATKTLTVKGGSLTSGDMTKEIGTSTFKGFSMPYANVVVGGSSLNVGASTTVTASISSAEKAWNISGLTSLTGLKAGDYMDVTGESPEGRNLLATDGIYFVSNDAVLYAENDVTVNNMLGTALNREKITTPASVGLGAAEGKKMTVTQGATALGQGDGLRIVGGGEVELQTGNAEKTSTQLALADGSTLTVTGDNGQDFVLTGNSVRGESSLAVQNGSYLKITDGSTVHLKSFSAESGSSYLGGQGSFDFSSLSIGGGTSCIGFLPGEDAVKVQAGKLEASGQFLNVLVGNSLQATEASFTGTQVTVMDTMRIGSLSSVADVVAQDGTNWAYYITLSSKTGDAFTAEQLALTVNNAKSTGTGTGTAQSLSDAKATVNAGGQLTVSSALNSDFVHGKTQLAAEEVSGGLSLAVKSKDAPSITGDRVKLSDSKLAKEAVAKISSVEIAVDKTLTMTDTASLTVDSLTGDTLSAEANSVVKATSGSLHRLSATDSASVATAQSLAVDQLSLSGDAKVSAASLSILSGSILIPTSTFSLTPNTTTFDNVTLKDAVLGTTQGTVSRITSDAVSSAVSIGTGYTLIGRSSGSNPATVDVDTLSLADGASLVNIAVGASTAVRAIGTQTFNKVNFAGGYSGMSFDGSAAPYIKISSTLPYASELGSVSISGTAAADKLGITFLEVNGRDLAFVKDAVRDYTLFSTEAGVTIDFDTANINARQFNIAPYTYATLTVDTVGDVQQITLHGREAKAEISTALRDTNNRSAAMEAMTAAVDGMGAVGKLREISDSIGDVYHYNLAERQQMLSAASGASLTALSDVQRRGIEDSQKNLRNRIVQMGGAEAGALKSWEEANLQAWAQADGAYHSLDQDGDNNGYEFSTYGATVGANLDLNSHWTVGGSLSASYGEINGRGADHFEADTASYYLNLFTRYQKGHWTHIGILTVGMDDVDTERKVLGYSASGSTTGTSLSGYYEVGYIIPLSDTMEHIIQPIVNVSLTTAAMDGFSESGSIGNGGLAYESNDLFYGNVGAGVRYQGVLAKSVYERKTVLEARLQFNQHFGDQSNEASVRYLGGGHSYGVAGSESGDFGVQVGAGLSIPYNINYTFFGDLDMEFRSQQSDVRANIGVRYDF